MANNGKIRFLRANASNLDSSKKLKAGQPLYIADKNYLTVGNLNDDNKASNAQPIDARRIHGYTSDNNTLNNTNTGEYKVEPYIFDTNKSGLLIKAPDEIKLEADKVSATEFTGNLKGNVSGNVTGDLTGNVTGNLTGNVTGNCSGSSSSCTGNAGTVTNGVYTTDFNTSNQTSFGSYIIEKKKRLFYNSSGKSTSESNTSISINLSESVSSSDVVEIVYKQQITNGIKRSRFTGLSARITDFYYYGSSNSTSIYFLNFPLSISGTSMTVNRSSTKVISLPNTEGGTVTQTLRSDFDVTIYAVYKIIE